MSKYLVILLAVLLSVHFYATNALGHGVIGKRFIPSTLTLEDPLPSDEMDLLTFDRAPKDKEGRETSLGFELGERLTPDFAIGVGWEYIFFDPREAGEHLTAGAVNLEFSLTYDLFRTVEHAYI